VTFHRNSFVSQGFKPAKQQEPLENKEHDADKGVREGTTTVGEVSQFPKWMERSESSLSIVSLIGFGLYRCRVHFSFRYRWLSKTLLLIEYFIRCFSLSSISYCCDRLHKRLESKDMICNKNVSCAQRI